MIYDLQARTFENFKKLNNDIHNIIVSNTTYDDKNIFAKTANVFSIRKLIVSSITSGYVTGSVYIKFDDLRNNEIELKNGKDFVFENPFQIIYFRTDTNNTASITFFAGNNSDVNRMLDIYNYEKGSYNNALKYYNIEYAAIDLSIPNTTIYNWYYNTDFTLIYFIENIVFIQTGGSFLYDFRFDFLDQSFLIIKKVDIDGIIASIKKSEINFGLSQRLTITSYAGDNGILEMYIYKKGIIIPANFDVLNFEPL